MENLQDLQEKLLAGIRSAAGLKELDELRVAALGKKGSITEKMKTLGTLPPEEKIAAGKMNKFFEENCLLQQAFVKDGSVTVEQYMHSAAKALGGSVKFVDAVRFEKGEGIEKKVDDFAAEVAAAAGLAK